MTTKQDIMSPMYEGLTMFMRWRDGFLAEYGKLEAQRQAQLALYLMDPNALTLLMLSSPEGMQALTRLAKGE